MNQGGTKIVLGSASHTPDSLAIFDGLIRQRKPSLSHSKKRKFDFRVLGALSKQFRCIERNVADTPNALTGLRFRRGIKI